MSRDLRLQSRPIFDAPWMPILLSNSKLKQCRLLVVIMKHSRASVDSGKVRQHYMTIVLLSRNTYCVINAAGFCLTSQMLTAGETW